MPSDDQDAGAGESVQDVIAKVAWDFEREDHEVDPNIRAHALSIRVQGALTEAGLCIVEREDVAKAADAVLDLMSRREMQAFRHEWVDVHRRMTAAAAPGAEDAP